VVSLRNAHRWVGGYEERGKKKIYRRKGFDVFSGLSVGEEMKKALDEVANLMVRKYTHKEGKS